MLRTGLVVILFAMLPSTSANAEKLFSYFVHQDDQQSLLVSPCSEEETSECLSHSLSCEKASRGEPQLTVIADDVDKMVSSLIVGTSGQVSAQLKLADRPVDLPINSIRVDRNELDVGWTATVSFDSSDDLFEAITDKSAEAASLLIAGKRYLLAPQKGDGSKLASWAKACLVLQKQLRAE